MAFVEVTNKSWLSRIMSSVVGALIGFVMFIVAFPLLFWNEGRAVQTMKSLEEGQGAVVKANAAKVDPSLDMKLVHVSGTAATTETLKDPDFGVSANAIRLEREAEMYQWVEKKSSTTRKKLGGGEETVTTYTYKKDWVDHRVASSDFKEDGHENPSAMKYLPARWEAQNVTLGAYTLIPKQIEKIGGSAPLEVTKALLENAPRKAKLQEDGVVYVGESSENPRLGDERISFKVTKAGPLSLIAQQTGTTFQEYQTKAGDAFLLVEDGLMDANQMFQSAQEANTMMTWVLRIIGFVVMLIGLALVFKPLSVLGDVVPFIGSMIGAGAGLFAFLVSAALSLLTVAIAWMFYRPLLGIPLLLLSGGALYLVFTRGRKKKAEGLSAQSASQPA